MFTLVTLFRRRPFIDQRIILMFSQIVLSPFWHLNCLTNEETTIEEVPNVFNEICIKTVDKKPELGWFDDVVRILFWFNKFYWNLGIIWRETKHLNAFVILSNTIYIFYIYYSCICNAWMLYLNIHQCVINHFKKEFTKIQPVNDFLKIIQTMIIWNL